MSSAEAFGIVVAVLAVSLTGALWLLHRLRQAAGTRDRLIREACEAAGLPPADSYEGPDSLRLMQELDAHLDDHFAKLAGLYERLGPPPGPDPMAAVRDNQNQLEGGNP